MIKKFLAIAAVAAMLIACGEPEENKPQGGTNNGGNTEQPGGNENQEPEEPEEPAFVGAISVDGDFADWDALTAEQYVEATLPTSGTIKYPVLKNVKFHADEFYIYMYMEFDPRGSYNDTTDEYSGVRYLDLFINEDNDNSTGRQYAWNTCYSTLAQGAFYNEATPVAWNPSFKMFTGADMDPGWGWEDLGLFGVVNAIIPVKVSDEVAKFECSLSRLMLSIEMAETIDLGVIVETEGWTSIGQLPQWAAEDTDDSNLDASRMPAMVELTLPAMAE